MTSLDFFNFCVNWNINGWNIEKKDGLLYFIDFFKPICICLQEIGNSQFLNEHSSKSPFLNHYRSLIRKADLNIPGMRGLYIGIHSSFSFLPDPFEFKYIISVNIISFWGISCSIGNIYIPTTSHKESRNQAFSDLKNWLELHNHSSKPTVLMGDFNMPKDQTIKFLSKLSTNWHILALTGSPYTWSRGGKSSCIDHFSVNDKMLEFVNQSTVCSTFNDLSDHFPLILSCRKADPEGFQTPPPKKTFRWSNKVCKTKCHDIFSHNLFSALAEDFSSNNDSTSSMVNKFLDTANKIGDEINARIPSDLEGSSFHCPHYIKKLSHLKHNYFKKIKEFSLNSNLSNINEFLSLNKEYSDICDKIKSIKSNIR